MPDDFSVSNATTRKCRWPRENSDPVTLQAAGLYIHIPFCRVKCPYCDFYSITDQSLVSGFIDGLIGEMRLKKSDAPAVDTVYLGGGTPSVLDAPQMDRIITGAHRHLNILPDAEITLEVNPGTVDVQTLKDFRCAGVNRLNIGVQSFGDSLLHFLGRIHTGREARRAVISAQKAEFNQMGLDLIYGIPGQTQESWLADLAQAADLDCDHLSCYMLTIEPGTPMAEDLRLKRFAAMTEQTVAALFASTQSFLQSRGYTQYEISNFAMSETAMSRHNKKYWSFAPYDGLGPAAHSYRHPVRWWNHRSVSKYLKNVGDGIVPVAGKEVLGIEQQLIETIYLGLRTVNGIDVNAFNRRFDINFYSHFSEPVTALQSEGVLSKAPDRCALTEKGMRFHEGIAKMLIEYIDGIKNTGPQA